MREQNSYQASNDNSKPQAKRRAYKAEWQRNKRRSTHSYTVYYTEKEHLIIKKYACAHKCSRTAFIKTASLNIDRYIVPDPQLFLRIEEQLISNHSMLINIADEAESIDTEELVKHFNQLAKLESDIMETLRHPKQLLQCIEEAVAEDTRLKEEIIFLLNTMSK